MVRCLGAGDVATAFDSARSHGLDIAVRGAAPTLPDTGAIDDGLVIDLSAMRRVRSMRLPGRHRRWRIDLARLRRGDAGVRSWSRPRRRRLDGRRGSRSAVASGTSPPSTGSRDNLVGAELVTPDGSIVRAGLAGERGVALALRGGGRQLRVWLRGWISASIRWTASSEACSSIGATALRDVLRVLRDVVARSPRDLSCQCPSLLDEVADARSARRPRFTGLTGPRRAERPVRPVARRGRSRQQTFLEQQLVFDSPYGESRHYWKGHCVRSLGRPDRRARCANRGVRAPAVTSSSRSSTVAPKRRGWRSRRRSRIAKPRST